MATVLSTVCGVPGTGSGSFAGKMPGIMDSLQSGQVFASFDTAEFERVRQEQADIDALLRSDLETAVGPSTAQIAEEWTEALFFLDQNPGETVVVSSDIENADLATLVNKLQTVSVLENPETVGTVETPDSSVTFLKSSDGWLFFRITGNA